MYIPNGSLTPYRYWGVTFDSLLFDRAIVASEQSNPRMLSFILDAVHRRLVCMLAVTGSCLDTAALLLIKEHEV